MKREQLLAAFTPSIMSHETLEAIFVRREMLASRLMENVRAGTQSRSMRHTLLVGPRGIGKTHLVSLVYHRVRQDHVLSDGLRVAWLREEMWEVGSYLDLIENVLATLATEYDDDSLAAAHAALAALPVETAEAFAERSLLEFLSDRILVLIVENVEDIFESIGEIGQRQLRAFLQNHTNALLVATTPSLFYGISNHDAPFYGFFHVSHLDELSLDDAVTLLEKIANLRADENLLAFLETETGRDRLSAVQHLAGGHPRIWIFFAGIVTEDTLDSLVPAFLEMLDDLTPYYQSRMKELPPQQRKIVSLLCTRRGSVPVKEIAAACRLSQPATGAQLHELRDKGFVRSESVGRESWYELKEPLMRLVLEIKESRGRPIRLIVDFLRHWYNRAERHAKYATLPDDAPMTTKYVEAALDLRGFVELVPDPRKAELPGPIPYELVNVGEYDKALTIIEEEIEAAGSRVTAEHWQSRGVCLFFLNRYSEALDSLDLAIERNPKFAAAYFYRGRTLGELKRHSEALDSLDFASNLGHEDTAVNIHRGLMLVQLERHGDAVRSFDRAIELGHESSAIYQIRGIMLDRLTRYEDALASFGRALTLRPTDVATFEYRAKTLGEMARYVEALADYDRAIELDSNRASVHSGRGYTLVKLERFAEALVSFDRAIDLDPMTSATYCYRGVVLGHFNRYDEALASYDRAIAVPDPINAYAYFLRGATLVNLERYEDALDSFNSAIELDPGLVVAHYNRGKALLKLARFVQAVESFDRAIELDPESAQVHYSRGQALVELACNLEAVASFDRAIELDPNDVLMHYSRGKALKKLDRLNEAIESFDRAIALAPSSRFIHYSRGYLLGMQNRYVEALDSFDNCIRIDPDDADSYVSRGFLLNALQRYLEAVESLNISLQIEPRNALTHYNRAKSFLALGQWSDFITDLEQALNAELPEHDDQWGYSRSYCQLLFVVSTPELWPERIGAIVHTYDDRKMIKWLAKGLTESLPGLFEEEGSPDEVLALWNSSWQMAGKDCPDLEIPLRLLDAAVRWHKKPDRRILLALPAEERSVLQSLLPAQ